MSSSYESIERKVKELLPNLNPVECVKIALALDSEFKEFYKDLDFLKGGKAFFDYVAFAVANNWHGNPVVNATCQYENKIVMRFVEDALHSFDQSAHTQWLEISKLQAEIADLRKQLQDRNSK